MLCTIKGNTTIDTTLKTNPDYKSVVKSRLFSNTSRSAKASATIYSIVETAKENGLNPSTYLLHLFERLSNIDVKVVKKNNHYLQFYRNTGEFLVANIVSTNNCNWSDVVCNLGDALGAGYHLTGDSAAPPLEALAVTLAEARPPG